MKLKIEKKCAQKVIREDQLKLGSIFKAELARPLYEPLY